MLIHHTCPNCGADMNFNSETGMLSCDSCGHNQSVEQLEDIKLTQTFEQDDAREYHCENCGAVVVTDKDTTATSCSFCGGAVILVDRLSGELAPVQVIPFTISKEEAMQAFKKWCRNGRLTPKGFMTANRVKKITGMYVPFWMYDLNNDVEVHVKATKVRTYTSGEYQVTETSHYDVYRKLDIEYAKVPVDASEKLDDQIMDKLEPYNYNDLKPFKTAYLAGYLAEKYNYNDEQLYPRVKNKVKSYIDNYITSTINGYTSVHYHQKNINTKQKHSYYVLLPIWMIYYDLEKQEHNFLMNAQTGKIVGKPPVSMQKVSLWFLGLFSSSFVVLKIIALLLGGALW